MNITPSRAPRLRWAIPFLFPLFSALTLIPQGVQAQGTDALKMAQGQALYDEALKDMEGHHYELACPKLQQVIRLVPEGIGARITLGECLEAQGKLAGAWIAYREAQAKANAAGQKDRENKAKGRAEILEPKLAKLSIVVPSAIQKLSGLKIEKDGEPVDPALWNVALPVDKGEHSISVSAEGKESWKKNVVITKDGEKSSLEVGPLTDTPLSPSKESKEPKEPQNTQKTQNTPPSAATRPPPLYGPPVDPFFPPGTSGAPNSNMVVDPTARRIIGIGLGVVGLGAAGIGGYVLKTAVDKENALYDSFQCVKAAGICVDDASTEALSSAEDKFDLGIGLLIGGGVAALVGIVVFATADSYVGKSGDPSAQRISRAAPAPGKEKERNISFKVSLGLSGASLNGHW